MTTEPTEEQIEDAQEEAQTHQCAHGEDFEDECGECLAEEQEERMLEALNDPDPEQMQEEADIERMEQQCIHGADDHGSECEECDDLRKAEADDE